MPRPSPKHGTLRLSNDDDDIASIGKLYGDGGVLSMLVDSDVYAPATARLMLEGKQVSRGNRGMKVMLEALHRP